MIRAELAQFFSAFGSGGGGYGGGGGGYGGAPDSLALFGRIDTDGNGVITWNEVGSRDDVPYKDLVSSPLSSNRQRCDHVERTSSWRSSATPRRRPTST